MNTRFLAGPLIGAVVVAIAWVTGAWPASRADAADTAVTVCLQSSTGTGMAGGAVQVYSGGWKQLGKTDASGCVQATIAEGTFAFGMTHEGVYLQREARATAGATVTFQAVATTVQVLNSQGGGIAGAAVQYYAGGWHSMPATGNDGRSTVELLPANLSFGATVEGIYNQREQNTAQSPTVTFQATKTTISVVGSNGKGIAGAAIQYYAAGWRQLGSTNSNGVVTADLLPGNIPFGATLGGVYNQVSVDISTNPSVTFQAVATTVRVIDSKGAGLSGASLQYYANGWKQIGTSGVDGSATVDLLPGNLPFGASLGGVYNQKDQDIAKDPVVTFQAVATTVRVIDSKGTGLPGAALQYYANGWKQLGSSADDGSVTVELLPANLPFGANLGGVYNQKDQDIAKNPVVTFQSVQTTVALVDSTGKGIAGGSAQYYADGWKQLGLTDASGSISVELLPTNIPFGITLGGVYNQKDQDLRQNAKVTFATVATTVKLIDSTGKGIAGGAAQYYANGWNQLGQTDDTGAIKVELLPANIPFGMLHAGIYNQRDQAIGSNPAVVFATTLTTVEVTNSKKEPIAGAAAQYYANGWKQMGATGSDGRISLQLLPANIPFGITLDGVYQQKDQDTRTSSLVHFETVLARVHVVDKNGGIIPGASLRYYAGGWHDAGLTGADGVAEIELLPANLAFSSTYNGVTTQKDQNIGLASEFRLQIAVVGPAPAETPSPTPTTKPKQGARLSFVSDDGKTVTWRVTVLTGAEYKFNVKVATSCAGEGGPTCESDGATGSGYFPGEADRKQDASVLVYQAYTAESESTCRVTNAVEWYAGDGETGTVEGSYECSGATALGWLIIPGFVAAVLAAYAAKRRLAQ